jgi:hypothetical protein
MIDRPSTALSTAAFLVLTLAAGCRRQGSDGNGKEPRAIAQAFEDFEGASPSDRRAALESLKSAPCAADPADCADRDACVHYASALQNATELMAKARALGPEDAGGSGAASPEEYVTIVSAADDAVKTAEAARPACLEALDRLHRRAAAH